MIREIQNVSTALEGMVGGVSPSLVSVISNRTQISGFVWRPGRIVTSDEGLAEEGEVRVTLPGGEGSVAHSVGRDPSTANRTRTGRACACHRRGGRRADSVAWPGLC